MNQELRIKHINIYVRYRNLNSYFLNLNSGQGFIALSMILIISAVVVGIATTVTYLSIGEAQSSLVQQKGEDAWDFIDGCAEDALQEIHDSSTYAGGSITHPEGTCTITVNSGNPNWNITVTTTATNYKRSLQITATRGSTITITSWKEL